MLPNDPNKLFRLARASSKEQFERDSAVVLEDYDVVNGDGGTSVLVNRKLAAKHRDALGKYRQKIMAGVHSGIARANKSASA
jgi:hypothetical protein